jgi:hypothetical protein
VIPLQFGDEILYLSGIKVKLINKFACSQYAVVVYALKRGIATRTVWLYARSSLAVILDFIRRYRDGIGVVCSRTIAFHYRFKLCLNALTFHFNFFHKNYD